MMARGVNRSLVKMMAKSGDNDDQEAQFSFPNPFAKKDEGDCGGEKKENMLQQIKNYGIAGTISYAFWEWCFWLIGGAGAYGAYIIATGHPPDFNNQDDMAQVGGEAFAFINIARFAVPARIALAISTAPWVEKNVVEKFGIGGAKDEESEEMA